MAGLRSRPKVFVLAVEFAKIGGRSGSDANVASKESIEGFEPEDLAAEDVAEIAGDGFGDAVEGDWCAEFLRHRGDGLGGEAAGDDELKVGEIRVDVEGEAVRRYGAGNVDADGGDLCRFCRGGPDTSELGDTRGGDAEVGAGTDEGFFHFANELDRAEGFALAFWGGEGAEIEDRVADELAGTMEGDVAAAVAFDDFYALLG